MRKTYPLLLLQQLVRPFNMWVVEDAVVEDCGGDDDKDNLWLLERNGRPVLSELKGYTEKAGKVL